MITKMLNYIIVICMAFIPAIAHAFTGNRVSYEAADSIEVENWLAETPDGKTCGELMLFFAEKMKGRPYVAATLEEGNEEHLIVNLRQLDCTTLVENAVALSVTAHNGGRHFADFCNSLRSLRYRNGTINGYSSRLHYFSDWITDNERKGIVTEIGKDGKFPFTAHQVVHAYFMSANPQYYKHLKNDPHMIALIKEAEESISGTSVNYIPKRLLAKVENLNGIILDGDIIALVTNKKGLEISHVGIAIWATDGLHLLNASSLKHKVITDTQTLYEYQSKRKSQLGIRVIRVK